MTAWSGRGTGDALVLFGALSAAAYTIVARRLSPEEDPLSVTAVQFTTATVLAVPMALVAWGTGAERVPAGVEPRYVVAAALVGVVGFAGSFVLYNFAIATVEAAPAAIIINLIPAVGLASAVAWLGEPLTMYAAVGAMLICASVAIFAALEALADVGRARGRGGGRRRATSTCGCWSTTSSSPSCPGRADRRPLRAGRWGPSRSACA